MLKKLILIVILFTSNITFSGPGLTPEQKSKIANMKSKIVIRGDAVIGINLNNTNIGYKFPRPVSTAPFKENLSPGWITSISRLQINTTDDLSMYDLMSNGTPNNIAQNPYNPNNIHTCYMWDNLTDPPSSSPNRRVKYWKSTNKGVSWSFVANVPDVRAGYGVVDIYGSSATNSFEIIADHSVAGGGSQRAQAFLDIFEGLGSFTRLDPGDRSYNEIIWPRIVTTSNSTLANKFIMIGAVNSSSFDSSFYNVCTSVSSPGTWLGWQPFNGTTAETYKIARGSDGRIGLVFIANNLPGSPTLGDIYFTESTNNGSTFGTPYKIFDANFTTDSLAALRGIDIVYLGNSPKVVFETIKQTQEGGFFPGAPNNIRFWSPILPGSDPNRSIIIADTSKVGYHPSFAGGASSDVLAPLCRCGIGISGSAIFVTFMAVLGPNSSESYVGGSYDTCSFNSIWLTGSVNGGLTWAIPGMISPFDTTITMKDWTFPGISKWNDTSASAYYANITVLMDSIPGSYFSHESNGYAVSKLMFIRVSTSRILTSVNNNSNEIPGNFELFQNYPNPFNPTTNIRYSIPRNGYVRLIVYDALGREVETLANEKQSAGTYESKWDASKFPSGIYFYRLITDGFSETKKMLMIK